jgi:magnesium-transporting ATPase (P-type)
MLCLLVDIFSYVVILFGVSQLFVKVNVVWISACVDIAASYLVPGDVIRILPDGGVMACDVVLFTGNFIVHESMLRVKMISCLFCVDLW